MLDGVDSGLSIDNIRYLQKIFKMIIDDCAENDVNVYIVVTSNAYELTKDSNCIDVKTGEIVEFKDYEDFVEYICKSQKEV